VLGGAVASFDSLTKLHQNLRAREANLLLANAC